MLATILYNDGRSQAQHVINSHPYSPANASVPTMNESVKLKAVDEEVDAFFFSFLRSQVIVVVNDAGRMKSNLWENEEDDGDSE